MVTSMRALKMRPVKVLYPDSERTFSNIEKNVRSNRHKQSDSCVQNEGVHSSHGVPEMAKHPPRREHTTNLKDQLGGLKFERTVPGDKRLARVVSVARSMTFREHQFKILSVYTLCELPLDKLKRATLVKVTFEEYQYLPDPSWLTFPQVQRGQSVPLSLICDNVREPGHHPATMSCSPRVCHDDKLGMGIIEFIEISDWCPFPPSPAWTTFKTSCQSLTVHVADNCSGYEREIAENMEANQSNKP
uniref:Uncharacterized protein n=1 Tax=Oncorhynchus kisutch TaxID=8019 RepID=A0A8C7HMV2_ONCKI